MKGIIKWIKRCFVFIKGIFEYLKRIVNKYKNFKPLESKVDLRFLVISDIHISKNKSIEKERLKYVLKTMYRLDPNIDAIAIVGDLTDSGDEEEYKVVEKILKRYKREETILVACMGNHEGNTSEKFRRIIGVEPKEDKIINGYHFITLSPKWEKETYGDSRYYLDEEWLNERLNNAINEDKDKPIFVFMHHGVKDTAYGTDKWNTEDLKETLSKYESIIHFSGHSHYPLNSPRSIYQKDFTAINTSTTSYFELEDEYMYGSIPPKASRACQAMIVEVKGKEVTIIKIDLIDNSFICSNWTIDTSKGKEGFKYLEDRKDKSYEPYFEKNEIAIEEVESYRCKIRIRQANIDDKDDFVHSYEFSFKNLKTNKVENRFKVSSQFYIKPIPETLSETFEGLSSDTNYEVEVKAFNCYGKESSNSMKQKFTTKKAI